MLVIQDNEEYLEEYEELVAEYEESRLELKARILMKFKSIHSPSKLEINIAIVLLYFLYQIDDSIRLRTDKRQLEDKSWNFVQNYFRNSGKIIQNFKKILPFLEDKKIPESHFFEIKRYMETLSPTQIEVLHNKNGVTGLMFNYAMA